MALPLKSNGVRSGRDAMDAFRGWQAVFTRLVVSQRWSDYRRRMGWGSLFPRDRAHICRRNLRAA